MILFDLCFAKSNIFSNNFHMYFCVLLWILLIELPIYPWIIGRRCTSNKIFQYFLPTNIAGKTKHYDVENVWIWLQNWPFTFVITLKLILLIYNYIKTIWKNEWLFVYIYAEVEAHSIEWTTMSSPAIVYCYEIVGSS